MSLDVRVATERDPAHAWDRLANFAAWPTWNPVCVAAEVLGPVAPGTLLRLRMLHPRGRAFWTTPRLTVVDPGRRLGWEARGLGFRARTTVTFTGQDAGTLIHLASGTSGPLGFTYRLTLPEKTQALMWSGVLTALGRDLRREEAPPTL